MLLPVLTHSALPLVLAVVLGGVGQSPILSDMPTAVASPSGSPAPSPVPPASGSDQRVCAYLGVVNGDRVIDPGFALSRPARPAASPTAAGESPSTGAAVSPPSGDCHPIPSLIPLRGAP